MKSKITLKELVGTKIIYAVLLVCYYWMWARRDWHSCYEVIQHSVAIFTIVFFALQAVRIHRYSKEEKDELAIQNLRRTDAIGLKLMVAAAIIIAFACAVGAIGGPAAGYGLVGMIIIVPCVREIFHLPDGANLFSAILVLAVMILPSVISVSETAIKAVPKEYEEASLALGATKTETIFKVVVPAAKSGIVTAVVLGIGRAVGEAMAVMMVAGNVANMPELFGSVRFLTTAVASEMSYSSGLQRQALFSIALVLFLFIMAINLILNVMIKKGEQND